MGPVLAEVAGVASMSVGDGFADEAGEVSWDVSLCSREEGPGDEVDRSARGSPASSASCS